MKKIITYFITVIILSLLSLPVSSLAVKEQKLNLDSGSAGSKNKFSAVRKAVVLAPVTLLAGEVLHMAKELQKKQPHVTIKKQLLAKFNDYKSALPKYFTCQEQIDAFVNNKYAEIYLDLMRNVDLMQGPVLWGGDLEIAAIVLKYKICIRVIDNDQGTDIKHGEEYETKITIKRTGGHYKYIDISGKEFDVPSDGNCMFAAILMAAKSQKLKIFSRNILELRNEVVDYIDNNYNLKKNIIPDNHSNEEKVDGEFTLEEIVNKFLNVDINTKYLIGRDYCKTMTDEEVNSLLDKLAKSQLTGVEKEKAELVFIYKSKQKHNEKYKKQIDERYGIGRDYRKIMTDEEVSTLLNKFERNKLSGVEKEKAENLLIYEKRKKQNERSNKSRDEKYYIGRDYRQNMTNEEVNTLLNKFAKGQLTGLEKEKAEIILHYDKNQKYRINRQQKYVIGRDFRKTMTDEQVHVLLDKLSKNQLTNAKKEKAEAVLLYDMKKKYDAKQKQKYVIGRDCRKDMTDEETRDLLDKFSKNQLIGVEKEKAKAVFFYENKKESNRKNCKKRIRCLHDEIDQDNKLECEEQEDWEVIYKDYENYGEDEDENESEDLVGLVREFLLRNQGMGL